MLVIELQYKLEPKDIWAFRKNKVIYSLKHKKRHRFVINVLSPIGFFVVFFGYFWSNGVQFYTVLYNAIIFTFFWATIAYPLISELFVYRRIKEEQLEKQKINIEESGITIVRKEASKFYQWSEVVSTIEANSNFLLYVDDSKAIILPKRILDKESSLVIQQLLKKKVTNYIQQENTSLYKIPTKVRIILLVVCLVIYGLVKEYEDKQVVVNAKEDVYDLFVGTENNMEIKAVLDSELKLKETVTRDEIEELKNYISYLQSKETNKEKRNYLYELGDLVHRSEFHLVYANLTEEQTTRVYDGESENWGIKDYTIRIEPELFETTGGYLFMKDSAIHKVEYFKIEVHMLVEDEQDILIHQKELAMEDSHSEYLNPSEQSIGEYSQQSYRFVSPEESIKKGLDKINTVYMEVQWKSQGDEELIEEYITLHSR